MPLTFLRAPHATGLRRIVFRVHLWMGLVFASYAVAMGLSGAALVFSPEIEAHLYPALHAPTGADGPAADPAVVFAAMERAYPGYRVGSINWPTRTRRSFVAYPARDGDVRTVFAHPVTGAVLGELPRDGALHWIRTLHVYLLADRTGLRVNSAGAAALVVMCLTGLLLWWRGLAGWTRGFVVHRYRTLHRLAFDLHNAAGIWTFGLLLVWGVSGFYLTSPQLFRQALALVAAAPTRVVPPSSTAADAGATPPPAASLVARAVAAVPGSRAARYSVPAGTTGAIAVLVARDEVGDRITTDEVTVYFDQYSGRLLDIREPPARGVDWVMAWLFPVHAGWFGGVAIKLLWLLLAGSLPLLAASALVMWWQRRGRRI